VHKARARLNSPRPSSCEPTAPIVDIDQKDIEALLQRARKRMTPQDCELIEAMAKSLVQLTMLVRERGTTISRLRRLFGLSGSEKSAVILDQCPTDQPGANQPPTTADDASSAPSGVQIDPVSNAPMGTELGPSAPSPNPGESGAANPSVAPPDPAGGPTKKKRPGHGRIASDAYQAAQHIQVPHQTLRPGDHCPKCRRSTLFALKHTVPIVRISGSPPLAASCWHLDALRCSGCGFVFTARAPDAAQGNKYDETAASTLALLHYGAGMPLNRLERLQRNLQTPVPSSTQSDLLRDRVPLVRPVYDELVRVAAQGQLLHDDDSYMRVLEFMGKRRAALVAKQELPDPERTGLFTTAIISVIATIGMVALFFTGRKHAGENLADVLRRRVANSDPPILMSDALSRNVPNGPPVLECNCIAHGRRLILDELDNFPDECRFLLHRLSLVFKVDEDCKKQKLSDQQRLAAHQRDSAPIMKELESWMTAQIEEKRIEPNSGLGKAFNYFLKRWDKFTLFLRVPGAPLDNNIVERALKMAICYRNNSLFYRTQRGATVGDIFMTLIHTAELHHENPFHYLTELQRNHKAVAQCPADWLPWNYRAALARLTSASNDVAA
jgi:transposase